MVSEGELMSADREALEQLFETASLGSPENAVGFVLWRVFHRWQREADRTLAPLGLTHLQFTTLTMAAWLERSGEVATQAELARFGDIHPMQVSLMLRALEVKGFVRRSPDAGGGKAKRASTTPEGLAVLHRALPAMIDLQARLFGKEGRPGGEFLTRLLGFANGRQG